ncbi:MAG: hypothetical protein HW416_1778 [Chloroflexi bacterium]|nr:hypothetical protein [Chloroflexota bacterium]
MSEVFRLSGGDVDAHVQGWQRMRGRSIRATIHFTCGTMQLQTVRIGLSDNRQLSAVAQELA